MKKIKFCEYIKDIKDFGCIHGYIHQDYGYDELGNMYLIDCYSIKIKKDEEILYSKDVVFKNLEYCKKILKSESDILGLNLKLVVIDKNEDDNILYLDEL